MNKSTAIIFAFAAACLPATVLADAAAGQAKAKQVCAACHGENGDKPLHAEYAILAGQHRDYLAKVLADYKSGARKNAIMGAQVQNLTNKEIQDLAEWFSKQKGPLSIKH